MAVLRQDLEVFAEGWNLIGRYNKVKIAELTLNSEPFLITGDSLIIGPSSENMERIMTFSTVSEKDCAGHFGPKFLKGPGTPRGPENLKIPLLHLSRCMVIASQIASRMIYPDLVPMPFSCKNVRANSQNLIPPPAMAIAVVENFESEDDRFKVKAFAHANGDPYAEMGEIVFKLIPENDFQRKKGSISEIPKSPSEILKGYEFEKEMYHSDINELILEREPFQNLDKAIVLKSPAGDLRLITISRMTEESCSGQLLVDGQSTVTPIDYCRLMALTAELMASIVTRERFDGFSVVPIAVRVDSVDTPNLVLLSPPATVVTEASISAKNLSNPRMINRGRNVFWADSASCWVGNTQVSSMKKITYALVPEEKFFEEV